MSRLERTQSLTSRRILKSSRIARPHSRRTSARPTGFIPHVARTCFKDGASSGDRKRKTPFILCLGVASADRAVSLMLIPLPAGVGFRVELGGIARVVGSVFHHGGAFFVALTPECGSVGGVDRQVDELHGRSGFLLLSRASRSSASISAVQGIFSMKSEKATAAACPTGRM